jgi:hypothetical protein
MPNSTVRANAEGLPTDNCEAMDTLKPATADPIYARLAEWRAALAAFDACDEAKDPEMYETLSLAEIEAQKVVYATKPTTIAGVMTLASYLAVDENCDDACIGDLALKQGLLTIRRRAGRHRGQTPGGRPHAPFNPASQTSGWA